MRADSARPTPCNCRAAEKRASKRVKNLDDEGQAVEGQQLAQSSSAGPFMQHPAKQMLMGAF
jgi:hypothetical protein